MFCLIKDHLKNLLDKSVQNFCQKIEIEELITHVINSSNLTKQIVFMGVTKLIIRDSKYESFSLIKACECLSNYMWTHGYLTETPDN